MSTTLNHIFVTTHVDAETTMQAWDSHCEEVVAWITAMPSLDMGDLKVYGPDNVGYGLGSFCLELHVTTEELFDLLETSQSPSDRFPLPITIAVANH